MGETSSKNIMAMIQNKRTISDYTAEWENYIDSLVPYEKAKLLQIFIWGVDKNLVEKVLTAHPKTLLSDIGTVEDLELAMCFAH